MDSEWAMAIIPSCVTIAGFFVTYFLARRNTRNEIRKMKSSIALHKMASIPYEAATMISFATAHPEEQEVKEKMKRFNMTIFSYGTEKLIDLASSMMESAYSFNARPQEKDDSTKLMAYYGLIAAQAKLDVSAEIASPDHWFKIQIKDYDTVRPKLKGYVNDLVSEKNLNPHFRIE